jgi:hypothetical protein
MSDEEGRRDPLDDLAQVFGEDAGEGSEVRGTVPSPAPGPPPPLTPHSILLPLQEQDGFGWPQFENFCADLVGLLPEVESAALFGGSGSTQEGIDVVAELIRGGRLGVQCKQRKTFGPSDVDKAVGDTTYEADGYLILLSRVATAGARRAIDKHRRWRLLDVADLSRLVRTLSPEDARRLVETHFGPQWRQRILGRTGPALFRGAESVTAELCDETRLFHQGWTIVGREEELESLRRFRESDGQVAVLPGPGGIGKSRLLAAIASEAATSTPGKAVFLAANVAVTPEGLDELPLDTCLVVIDDAHRLDDLDQTLDFLRRRQDQNPALKVLIGTRPRRLDELHSTLARSGFDSDDILILAELGALAPGDVRKLAEEALGPEYRRHADALCAASRDCPLVTVVGGQLVCRNRVDPSLLQKDAEFRKIVLVAFEDELLGEIEKNVSKDEAQPLLEAVAAIGPLPVKDAAAIDAVADFLQVRVDRLRRNIGHLEKAGVLRRSGDQLRVSPDLLADFMLEQACLTEAGESTGYAKLVYDRFAGVLPGHVLRNLAELDWRMRTAGDAVDLLGAAWDDVEREVLAAGNAKRIALLGRLETIAYFQAPQVLRIVEQLLEHPNEPEEEPKDDLENRFGVRPRTKDDVRQKIPPVLRAAAYTESTVERVTEILWELGRDDLREQNRSEEHPLRILGELAGYAPNKPVGFNSLVLKAVERLLAAPDVHGHPNSILDAVGHALEREGIESWTRTEREVVMSAFLIDPNATQSVREKAISLLRKAATGDDVGPATVATKLIGEALGGPRGYFGNEIPEEVLEGWRFEQLELIGVLSEAVLSGAAPATLLAVVDALAWQIEFSPQPDVASAAEEVVGSIEETLRLEVAGIIHEPWSLAWRPTAAERFGTPSRERTELAALTERIALELIREQMSPDAVLGCVADAVAELEAAREDSHPAQLLMAICAADLDYGTAIAERLIAEPEHRLIPVLHALVVAIRSQDPGWARHLCLVALDRGDDRLAGAVARAYWTAQWTPTRNATDVEILERLVELEESIRATAVAGVAMLATVDPETAARIATDVVVGRSMTVAKELCGVFDPDQGMSPDLATDAELESVLGRLVEVDSIDEHEIKLFLQNAGARVPKAVISLLIARIEHKEGPGLPRYEPVPLHGLPGDLVSGASTDTLIELIEMVQTTRVSRQVEHWLPGLYRIATRSFGADGVAALAKLVEQATTKEEIERAARLTEQAPPGFIFEQGSLVESMLTTAAEIGEQTYDRVKYLLGQSTINLTRMGPVGEPAPEDLALVDRVAVVLEELDPDSLAASFYRELGEDADLRVRRQVEEVD